MKKKLPAIPKNPLFVCPVDSMRFKSKAALASHTRSKHATGTAPGTTQRRTVGRPRRIAAGGDAVGQVSVLDPLARSQSARENVPTILDGLQAELARCIKREGEIRTEIETWRSMLPAADAQASAREAAPLTMHA
jgi:hypothetical protein